eukprot:TRINITY_DN1914_c0_g1_i2.p1 TRINITY_DN1914_c0_g1~~TRINITY_DN1914_c0_g1_i2.p1  ORF type:complete len:135 (-),score=25.41 TRINITY_DN1914_c0_g1_i2:113-517(-)
MREKVEEHLREVSRDKEKYSHLLEELILQGLIRLNEPAVQLRCRQGDLRLVDSVIESAKERYAEKLQTSAPDVTVDNQIFLPAAPDCAGGVVLATKDGKIVLENTLESRLEVVFKHQLPEVRKRLFRTSTLAGA